ncbi:hypothetical protein ACFW6F_18115 [Streptomyces sp. NPDC058746]|uniref:hypothetical protein n=1 Tax=Streptomyces sp. NPDC058746 TaxID=3346622 RepID=UPI00369E48E6
MSGTDVPLTGLLAAFAVTGALAWPATGRRRGPAGISAALLAVQGVLHLVFSGSRAAEPAPAPAPAAAPVSAPVHHHMPDMSMNMGADTGTGLADGTGAMGSAAHGVADMSAVADGMAGMAGHGGLGMIAAHVLAGLLCAAWLARGEAAVFRLARALGAAALHAARPLARAFALAATRAVALPALPGPRPRPRSERPRRLRGALHAHAVVRRGPPAYRAFSTTAPGRPARA